MDNFLTMETEKSLGMTKTRLDNSSSFKDLIFEHEEKDQNKKVVAFQIDVEENTLEINGVTMSKGETILLQDFLNKIKF